MTNEQIEFWKAAYIAAIGNNPKAVADQAVADLADAVAPKASPFDAMTARFIEAHKAADSADGWIENTGECIYPRGTLIDVQYYGGDEAHGVSALTDAWDSDHVQGTPKDLGAPWFGLGSTPFSITRYRLHKEQPK